tara:strand:+ start:2221 stop:3699 length:1479 start_codon:yes stop_codon:yes gene_type:complete
MGQLLPKRFKENYKASNGIYKGQGYVQITNNKIKEKREFILGSNDKGQKVYGLELIKEKNDKFFISYANSKSSKKEVARQPVSKFFKDPDFGGGKGSGGGADDTAITESLQCYFLSILFNTSTDKLTNKNTELKVLQKQQEFCFTFDKTSRFKANELIEKCPEDWLQTEVFIKSANAIYNSPYAKPFKSASKVYFHRNSPYMKAVYENKKKAQDYDKKNNNPPLAPGSFNDDKWNPGDIWMSTKPTTDKKPFASGKDEPIEWIELREAVRSTADDHTLGISLKKVGSGSATITPFNTRKRIHNNNTKFSGFTFGMTGDFFASTDIYLHFNDGGSMQCRASNVTSQWQGNMTGKYAYAGKIGGGNINHYVEKIFKKSIGKVNILGKNWKETSYMNGNFEKMYRLYAKFINKQKPGIERQKVFSKEEFKKAADNYTNKGRNRSQSFYFAKYMSLLFLETIDAQTKGAKLDELSRVIVRYAMSNTDISTFFIKVS